ncbi:hypothetical protein [Natrinema salaciae]|uniref:Uncharacterized protein n=1 Tax=Natrinema salaciae TaxID=1186196 RepID=A0A1H9G5W2_9EURY|nr:hypothetical protein [Natrinema salaciae]SEQ45400.1 hypothetical protein SAMN04489841_1783 [Natrinema salaciae]
MTERPPSPSAPTIGPAIGDTGPEGRVVATTAQLTASIEDTLGCRLDEPTLEDLLLELDRHDYVDWVSVTRTGDHVWDLSDAPDRLGEAVAAAVVERLEPWLSSD